MARKIQPYFSTKHAINIQTVFIGPQGVGKSATLDALVGKRFTPVPLSIPYRQVIMKAFQPTPNTNKGCSYVIRATDVAGDDSGGLLRAGACAAADVACLLFDCNSRESFREAIDVWLPELRRNCSADCPILVVGTKMDACPEEPSLDTSMLTAAQLREEVIWVSAKSREGLRGLLREIINSGAPEETTGCTNDGGCTVI